MSGVILYPRPNPDISLLGSRADEFVSGPGWYGISQSTRDRLVSQGALASSASLGRSDRTLPAPPRLVISDVDSTLIAEEVIDQLAQLAGVYQQVAQITERAMRGELDFAHSLAQRVALLKGLPVSALEQVAINLHVRPGTQRLIRWVHENGGAFAVVSGGFTPVVQVLADELGIDHVKANDFEIEGGLLTGRVSGPIVTPQTKREYLLELRERYGSPVLAMGDGANDLPLLAEADLGVAVLAKPKVRESATAHLDWDQLDGVVGLAGFSLPEPQVMAD